MKEREIISEKIDQIKTLVIEIETILNGVSAKSISSPPPPKPKPNDGG